MPLIAETCGLVAEDPGEPDAMTADESAALKAAFALSMGQVERDATARKLYGKKDPLALTLVRTVDARASVTWSTGGHTDTAVPVYATGVGAERFAGEQDNTDVAVKIKELMGLKTPAAEPALVGVE